MSIDIDKLTIGELKQLVSLAAQMGLTGVANAPQTPHPFIGKYVICRCHSAGVHAGELVSLDGDKAILRNSRRLWYWKTKEGIALSGVAQNGIANDSKLDTMNPEIALTGVCEVIPCTDVARSTIDGHK